MNKEKNEQEIDQEARSALDKSTDDLSIDVKMRLQQARITALNAASNGKFQSRGFRNPWLGWGFAASLCLAVFLNMTKQPSNELASKPNLDEFILMASLDETEFEIIEDLEFAYWLSLQLETDNASSVSDNG